VGIRAATRRNRLQWCQALRFLEKPGPVVALASFPGSGNTWVRYLLQQVTGGNYRNIFISCKNAFATNSHCFIQKFNKIAEMISSCRLINQLTPWSEAILEKLINFQVIN